MKFTRLPVEQFLTRKKLKTETNMKTKMFILAAAFSSGIAFLGAQDAPKPPGEGAPGGPPPGGPQGGPPGGGDVRARFDEAFKKMDANGDGKISKEEWVEYRKKEAEEQFSKLDANNAGSIDKAQIEEGMRRLRGQMQGSGGRGGAEGFRRPEGGGSPGGEGSRRPDGFRPQGGPPGGDGGVRQRPGAEAGTPPPPPEGGAPSPEGQRGQGGFGGGRGGMVMGGGMGGIAEVLQKIRENGSISKEEFGKINDEQFKKLDANSDGKIDQAEVEQFFSKLREQFGNRGGQPGQPGQPGGEGGFRRRQGGDAPGGAPKEGGDKPRRPEAN